MPYCHDVVSHYRPESNKTKYKAHTAKAILSRSDAGGMTTHGLKYYSSKLIKAAWYWSENRHIKQWDRNESTEINSYTYNYLIFL